MSFAPAKKQDFISQLPIFRIFQEYLDSIEFILLLNTSKKISEVKIEAIYFFLKPYYSKQYLENLDFYQLIQSKIRNPSQQIGLNLTTINSFNPTTPPLYSEKWQVHQVKWDKATVLSLEFLQTVKKIIFTRNPLIHQSSLIFPPLITHCEYLDLSYCRNIQDFSYFPFLKKLKFLSLRHNLNLLSTEFLSHIPSLSLLECYNLEDISSLGYSIQTFVSLLECEKINNFRSLQGIPNLQLSACYGLKDKDLIFFQSCHSLDISYCRNITDIELLRNIPILNLAGCPQISTLSSMTNQSYHKLKLPDFSNQMLTIPKFQRVFHLSLRNFTGLRDIKILEDIPISFLDLGFNPDLIDVSPLQNNKWIQNLCLTGCGIINANPLKHISNLDLSHCSELVYIEELGDQHTLNLASCPEIIGVTHLFKVKQLNLSFSDNIIDEDVNQLLEVSYLEISHCPKLKNISYLLQNSRNLKRLNIRGNFHIIKVLVELVKSNSISVEDLSVVDSDVTQFLQTGDSLPKINSTLFN